VHLPFGQLNLVDLPVGKIGHFLGFYDLFTDGFIDYIHVVFPDKPAAHGSGSGSNITFLTLALSNSALIRIFSLNWTRDTSA
jgi:hypothetical protein